MYIVDTDVLSLLQRGDSAAAERALARVEAHESQVFVTIISFEEQMRGWLSFIAHAQSRQRQVQGYVRLYQLIEDFNLRQVLLYTEAAARVYELLRREYRRVGAMDLKISAIALERGATVITRNRRDYERIAGLQTEDWTA